MRGHGVKNVKLRFWFVTQPEADIPCTRRGKPTQAKSEAEHIKKLRHHQGFYDEYIQEHPTEVRGGMNRTIIEFLPMKNANLTSL